MYTCCVTGPACRFAALVSRGRLIEALDWRNGQSATHRACAVQFGALAIAPRCRTEAEQVKTDSRDEPVHKAQKVDS